MRQLSATVGALFLVLTCVSADRVHAADIRLLEPDRTDRLLNGSIDIETIMDLGNNMGDDGKIICNVSLQGPIDVGDLQKLQTVIKDGHFDVTNSPRVCLNSTGGNYLEGVRITEFLMDEGIGTALLPNTDCESACAIVFMGGTGHLIAPLNRFMHPSSTLGFHAPFLDMSGMEGLPVTTKAEKLAENYNQGVEAVRKLVIISENDRARFPSGLLVEMLGKKPTEKYAIDTVGKAIRYRIGLFDAVMPPMNPAAFCNVCTNYFYGADEGYGAHGKDPLCIPNIANIAPKRFPTGYRLEFDAAPRGGTCVIDVEQSGQATKGWYLRPTSPSSDFGSGHSELSVRLAYWFLYPPDTFLSALVRR